MAETCERCGLPRADLEHFGAGTCSAAIDDIYGKVRCDDRTEAYHRGLRDGAEVAKEYATIDRHMFRIVPTILWDDVDAEIARRVGEDRG